VRGEAASLHRAPEEARWSVRGVLRLVLVVLLSCMCCVVLLLVCAGVRVWVAPSGAELVCLMPAFDGCVARRSLV
jgi:hypothetical protein